ncbi:MAG: DUF502 domain-containing protein [Nitrospirae bacterium]|nr:DUF502 domain-containing protein [Nitrospirota bacterium]
MKSHIKKYFITGLLVIIPIWGTYLVLHAILRFLEGFIGNFLKSFDRYYIPGMGIISLLLLILLVGFFATNFIGRKIVLLWERLLEKVPLVSNIYSIFKHIVDTVSVQSKESFSRVVLVEFPSKGIYTIGFVTGVTKGEVQNLTTERVVNVFIPHTPLPTTGFFVFVPESLITPLSMSVEDGMKMVVSAGLYTPASFGMMKQSVSKETDNVKVKIDEDT